MLKLALCDDEAEQRAALIQLLREYAAARPELALKPSVFSSPRALLESVEEDGPFDLYLLDIVMPELSGIDLGIRLRELDSSGAIIYLTISPEYAVDSYAARAFYYLVKPTNPEQLFPVLDRAASELERQKAACVTVKTKDGLRRVRLDDILYAELHRRTVRYHLAGGERLDSVTVRGPFHEEIAPLLADPRFFQCGASFAANLFYVTSVVRGCFQMDGGKRVPLSRTLSAQARQRWNDYWLNSEKEKQP